MGGFFFILGAVFFVLGMSDRVTSSLEENANCQSGSCAEGGVRLTFLILGVSFIGTGTLVSFLTEFSIRKTTSILGQVKEFSATGSAADLEGITDFLKPFGITLDAATQANVNVETRTIDLRGQRSGEVPTDPAGLSAYLKSFGIAIDEDALREATVVRQGELERLGVATRETPLIAASVVTAEAGRRETATIVRKRDRGETADGQRLIEFELEVQPVGKVPYRVEVASLVRESLAGLLIEGSTLNVRVDPNNDNSVAIDWSEN